MFKVAGVSTHKGVTKVRFANDLVSRIKLLNKAGHTDVQLVELPTAMSKGDAVKHLKTLDMYATAGEAIDASDAKYNAVKVSKPKAAKPAKAAKPKKAAPSLATIKAKAGVVDEAEPAATE